MKALFDDGKNFGLAVFTMIVIEETCLITDAVLKLGYLENFFGWFNPQLTINGAMLSLAVFAGVLAAVCLTILFIFCRLDVYNKIAVTMKRICSAKETRGG